MRVLGAILCGGRSSRFGSDKAQALLGGIALVDHVRGALAPQVDALVACGGTLPGLETLPDRPARDLGPLAGLNAALHAAHVRGFDAVLAVPCDAPFLPPDLRARLEPAPSYLVSLPVAGLWSSDLAEALDAHLATDPRRSMRGWAARASARAVELDILNINTPDDLERADQILPRRGRGAMRSMVEGARTPAPPPPLRGSPRTTGDG